MFAWPHSGGVIDKALQGGDLSEAMSNDKSGRLRWYNRGQYIALDVVRGLAYLHACKVGRPPRGPGHADYSAVLAVLIRVLETPMAAYGWGDLL